MNRSIDYGAVEGFLIGPESFIFRGFSAQFLAIRTFDLKTPGREDEDEEIESEKKISLKNNDYTALATAVLEGVGGKDNVTALDYCATRLRFDVKDSTVVKEKEIKAAGAAGVIRPSKTTCQVIIGPKVQFVYDEVKKLL